MSDLAIRVVGLSKQYYIGGRQKKYDRLGEQLADVFAAPFRRAGKLLQGQVTGAAELDEKIWALRDVSFEIKRGEIVGIIGRNGAGKSTLLKILSRITEPTEGYAEVGGRVGSLLEVGTGFHPELTGRENIYLNGAILGMGKAEIERKFDEIVAFAEIDQFVDTPVKHYSSGMYVRLAFSVAAHLEPEILLVDEVLAVGDIAFQSKCLGKRDDVAQKGRTVLFVSHNLSLMQALCERGIFLNQGTICTVDGISETVNAYLQTLEQARTQNLAERTDRKGQGKIKFTNVEVIGGNGGSSSTIVTGSPVRFVFQVSGVLPGMKCSFEIFNQNGQVLLDFNNSLRGPDDRYDDANNGAKFVCEVDSLFLRPGRYRINSGLVGDNALQDYVEAAAVFDVREGLVDGRPATFSNRVNVFMPHRWTLPKKVS
jgi:lipopolysaccharide transport system ATP-binding protein